MNGSPAAVGIDYSATRLHLAIVRGNALLYSGQRDLGVDVVPQVAAMRDALCELLELAGEPFTVYLERPWLREGKGLGTAMKLHAVPTRVETIAAAMGMPTVFVAVNTWHLEVLGDGGLKSAAAKRAAIRYVAMVYGLETTDHNLADAICIASYGAALSRRQALTGAKS